MKKKSEYLTQVYQIRISDDVKDYFDEGGVLYTNDGDKTFGGSDLLYWFGDFEEAIKDLENLENGIKSEYTENYEPTTFLDCIYDDIGEEWLSLREFLTFIQNTISRSRYLNLQFDWTHIDEADRIAYRRNRIIEEII